jgi:MFS family permease
MSDTGRGSNFNNMVLFWASFFTLIAAGIGFSVRGAILEDWAAQYGFTKGELGTISGGGLIGFGVTIIALSFVADRIGYGPLMGLAFLLHASSAVVTFMATYVFNHYGKDATFTCLNIGMWLFALGNGTCEAVINPLTASLFPRNKTHWLNILHAGWPGGLVLGAVAVWAFGNLGGEKLAWEYKLSVFLIPVALYGLMMLGRRFPKSEASESGISMGTMIGTLFWPILIFLFVIHAMIGYVELGTDSWIQDITKAVLNNPNFALLAFIWTNVLMFTLRFFAGPIVHKINPIGLLLVSAILGTAGLAMLGMELSNSMVMWLVAATIYGIGKTFYWPTMLGVISERYPKGGALALGISGGIGMISAGMLGSPGIGYFQDLAANNMLQGQPAYERYQSYKVDEKGAFQLRDGKRIPDEKAFLPQLNYFPSVSGLDGSRVNVLLGPIGANKPMGESLKEEIDLLTKGGGKLEDKPQLAALKKWWDEEGVKYAEQDAKLISDVRIKAGKQALLWTAYVPATMAVCYLVLFLLFAAMGGYKQVHLEEGGRETEEPV